MIYIDCVFNGLGIEWFTNSALGQLLARADSFAANSNRYGGCINHPFGALDATNIGRSTLPYGELSAFKPSALLPKNTSLLPNPIFAVSILRSFWYRYGFIRFSSGFSAAHLADKHDCAAVVYGNYCGFLRFFFRFGYGFLPFLVWQF